MTAPSDPRLAALRRFAVAITALNVLGHSWLGFEQSWLQVVAALTTAYVVELLLEVSDAWARRRAPAFLGGGVKRFVDFMLPAHITGLAVVMLLYANDAVLPFVFAATVAVASKALFQATVGHGRRHFFNPSNVGICLTLVLFPWVGIAPPYEFTENVSGALQWLIPAVPVASGSLLHAKLVKRLPLITAWMLVFAAQAVVRAAVLGRPPIAGLLPMTGMAFLLYSFYMLPDPATTPSSTRSQIVFGSSVAVTYGALMLLHVSFGLFFALGLVCGARGVGLHAMAYARTRRLRVPEPVLPIGAAEP